MQFICSDRLRFYLGFDYFVVISSGMGNASGKSDEEGTSGEGYEEEAIECAAHGRASHVGYHVSGLDAEAEPMAHSPLSSPRRYLQPPTTFNPQA
ncbi:hypothetical protein GH714_022842 [Hevea brasiliensis]|uniref:Uncharacterized protein n=1 Tax=Hevea brasiliensis TaxID=3981 RepID=A0A6A6KW97_HEVBR|nr:hypothetical protein GH714_022842 [Hevea brasiliensis]